MTFIKKNIIYLFLLIVVIFTSVSIKGALPCDCLEDRILILDNPPLEGFDVLLLQERLKELNYYNGLLDSIYDLEVAKAVASFQEFNGLEVDGEVDMLTWDSLGDGVVPANQDEKKKAHRER